MLNVGFGSAFGAIRCSPRFAEAVGRGLAQLLFLLARAKGIHHPPLSAAGVSPMLFLCRRSAIATVVPSASTRSFATSSPRLATLSDDVDLAFPTKPNPTPWEIFHLDPSSPPTPKELKQRFYQLAKRYHPDRGHSTRTPSSSSSPKGKTPDTAAQFKQINEAYEILQNPARRDHYVRGTRPGSSGGGDPWNAYEFSRGRPMPAGRRWHPTAEQWDWAADPHNPHYRPAYGMGRRDTGWSAEGATSRSNGTVFLALLGLVAVVTPLSMWTAVPPELTRSSLASATLSEDELRILRSGVSGTFRKHEDAAKALAKARREAKEGGDKKREAMR